MNHPPGPWRVILYYSRMCPNTAASAVSVLIGLAACLSAVFMVAGIFQIGSKREILNTITMRQAANQHFCRIDICG